MFAREMLGVPSSALKLHPLKLIGPEVGLYSSIHSSEVEAPVPPQAISLIIMETGGAPTPQTPGVEVRVGVGVGVLVGAITYEIELSVLVLAVLLLPTRHVTRFAAMDGTKVPNPVVAVADTVKTVWSPESVIVHVTPVAVPFWVISAGVNILAMIASENTTVNLAGKVVVG